MKWGIVGLGNIAKEFAESMDNIHEIYGVSSHSDDKMQDFKKNYKVKKIYKSFEEMIADPEIDVIYISTINSLHYEYIMQSLRHGKHVLCEKAIWNDYSEIMEAYNYAQSHDLLLCEAMTIYHMPLFNKLKELIKEGKIGNLKFINADLGSLKSPSKDNRFFSKELGGGAMLDIGTYALSFINFFIEGEIYEQHHVMSKYKTDVDEMWSIALKSDQNILANVNLTFRAKLPKKAIIAGDKAYILIYNYVRAEEAEIVYPDGKIETIKCGSTAKALQYEIENFERSIQDGDVSQMYMDKTIQVVNLMDQLLTGESLK